MSVTASACVFACYLLLDGLRYGNMNGTMLSQIVRGMLSPSALPKVAKKRQKKPKFAFPYKYSKEALE